MRVFVVIASLVVLASADVKHLYDAPYAINNVQTVSHGPSIGLVQHQPSHGFGQQSFVQRPQQQTTFVQHQPSHGFGQQSFVQGPQQQTHFVQHQQPAFVQREVVHTTVGNNRFGGDSVGALPNTGFVSNSGFGNSGNTVLVGSGNSGFGGSANSGFGAVNSGFGGAVNGGNFHDSSSYGSAAYNSHTTIVKQTVPFISKSSYVFAAPEDQEDIQQDQTIILPRPQQHYKVIFIKAPSTTIVNHPSTAVGGQVQEKTLVYVLSDKKRIENHIEVPEIEQARPQKPEVFFIKYKKPTQVVNSQVKYETVDAVNGAEHGAINGVANKVTGNFAGLQDEASSPQQAEIAQQIFNAVKSGGLESGVQTVNQLIAGGHSVSGNFQPQAFDTISSGGSEQTFSTGLVQPVQHTVSHSAPIIVGSANKGSGGIRVEQEGYKY